MVFFKPALLVLILCTAEVRASLSTYKILGGYIAMYTESSTRFIRRDSEWGASSGSFIIVGKGYCRDSQDNYRKRYCQQRLYVTTSEYPDIAHYEFRGSYFERMDAERRRMDEVTYKNMISHAEPPYIDVIVFHGESWSDEYNEWGYGYLHYILEPGATRVPIVDAFSWIPYKKDDRDRYEPEEIVGDWFSTSRKYKLSEFRCHTQSFGAATQCHQYLWRVQTEVLDYKYNQTFESVTTPTHDTVLDSVVLENYGHGIGGTNLARVGTKQTSSITSSATFSGEFAVYVDRSIEINVGVSVGDSSIGMGQSTSVGAEFSFRGGITRTATSISSKEISWPSECPLGVRKTVALVEKTSKLNVPVLFTLKRGDATWTEWNNLMVTLKSVVIRNVACCLYRDASDECGTYSLMCPDAPPDAPTVPETNATNVIYD